MGGNSWLHTNTFLNKNKRNANLYLRVQLKKPIFEIKF